MVKVSKQTKISPKSSQYNRIDLRTIKSTKKLMNKSSNSNIFFRMFNVFENNIALHEVSISTIGSYALRYDKSIFKKLDDIIKNINTKKRKNASLSDANIRSFLQIITTKHPNQMQLFSKNTIVSIVSTLDGLFAKIFEHYYTEYPDKLSIENRNITFSELKKITNIEEAQKFLINREVELLLLQKGIKDRLKILGDSFGINILENSDHIQALKKVIKVRNLIIHNQGRADDEFINLYNDSKNNIKKGQLIKIDQKYLIESLALVYFIGGYVLQVAQSKLSKEPIENEQFIINNVMHKLLKDNKFNLLRPIYDYAISGGLNDSNKKMVIINYCIGLKKQGKEKEQIEKVLEKEDWTVVSSELSDFSMSMDALRGNHESFYNTLEKLINNKIISKDELLEWEIFSFYRKTSKFNELLELATKKK